MHISITGRLGSGKSTVARVIAENEGFEIYSTGAIIREMASDLGITALEMNELMKKDNSYDLKLDETTTKISKDRAADKLLFDSRMAWHFADSSFKVYLYVDVKVAAARVLRDSRGSVETYRDLDDAVSQLTDRMNSENVRYKKLYNVDNFDFSNYDIVIDTEKRSPQEVADIIMREYAVYCADPKGYAAPKMML
ncbi:MAG: cytidylate kinase family protein [Clostridia bacterium]|nr:cytidylate kinase family protein [Clostridia bacterium]